MSTADFEDLLDGSESTIVKARSDRVFTLVKLLSTAYRLENHQ